MEEKREAEKKRKTGENVLFIAVGIILLVIILVIGSRFLRPEQPKTIDEIIDETLAGKETEDNFLYNNYAFVKVGNMWVTRWQKGDELFTIPLRFNPLQVEDVLIEGELDERFDPAKLFITFDPTSESFTYTALAAAELSVNLATALDVFPTAACAANATEACFDRPIVSCSDEDKAVIFLREEGDTKVILRGNCMVLQGNQMELLKAVDRVLYIWYDIMTRSSLTTVT